MKNNVITIFIDSVAWDSVENNRAASNPMPFISSLKDESVTASKMYSHGPYTDAAIRSLFTGRNCLDDFGYYFRLNTSPINDFMLFHEAGYETYGFYYPFIMYGEKIKKYIDHTYFTSGFIFGSEWGGSFKFYCDKNKEKPLNSIEKLLLKRRFDLFFEVFLSYLKEIKDNNESLILYGKCLEGYDVITSYEMLKHEYDNYKKAPDDYIEQFLKDGDNHILWSIDNTRIDKIIDASFLDSIVKENKCFFKHCKRNVFRANLFSSLPGLKHLLSDIKCFIKTGSLHEMTYIKKYVSLLLEFNIMMRQWHKPKWQGGNTCHSTLSAGLKVISKGNLGKKRPFYMSFNTGDPHSNIAMFAYDIQDKDEVNDEIRVLKDYVDCLGTKFKGSLLYLLSLRYVDYEVQKFCNQLKTMGLWNNTTLLIVTDHGSSYTYHPIRKNTVNGFDEECYHIPMMIRHPGFQGFVFDKYANSKDILPTVCELIGIPKSPHFKGCSLLDVNYPYKSYVMTEYMGPGCPDLSSRRIWLSARDANFIVAYKVGIYESFEMGELSEVYDLRRDPKGFNNIANKIDRHIIDYLLEPIKERHAEISKEAISFLHDIEQE